MASKDELVIVGDLLEPVVLVTGNDAQDVSAFVLFVGEVGDQVLGATGFESRPESEGNQQVRTLPQARFDRAVRLA